MASWDGDEKKTSLSEDDLEDNYYMILNVNKDATEKEITQAYHRLGLVYHPDKHKDVENKRNAEVLFSKIKKAYDVLINPHKRAIYDTLGAKGLEQDGLQLVIRSKTPQEIREEYERISREREEKRIEGLTHSQGSFTMEINAKNLFESFSDTEASPFVRHDESLISIGNFNMEQYIDFPMSNKNTATLGGTMRTNGKFGGGSIVGSFRRILSSDTYLDFKTTLGANKQFTMLGFKRLTQKLNGSLSGLFRYKNGAIAPLFTGALNYQLDTHLVGQIQYKTSLSGLASAMITSLNYEKDNLNMNASIQLSLKNSYISVGASHKFNENDIKLKAGLQYGYIGTTLSYGIEKQITKYSRVDASIIINTMSGVLLNLGVERGSQTFVCPIHLSQEIVPSAIFYGTITPLVVYYVVKHLIINPYLRDKEEREAKLKQEKLKLELTEKRRLALAAQDLMKETVSRIIDREGPNGLIINRAIYGKIIDKKNPDFESEKILDVRIPLQFLVTEHSLQISSDQSKASLEGFYDPCIGESKTLYIEYKFKNEEYRATFEDNEVVRLPKSSHRVDKWWSRSFASVR